jgi:DNA-binding NarL/FixJ family response regulator
MITVLLAEDHNIVRKGIRALLEQVADIEVVGEVDNGLAAVDFVYQHKPNVVIMDINMPQLNGIQATEQICAGNPQTHIVILSQYSDETMVRQAIRAGAEGYLLKHSLVEELPLAIRAVHRGKTYLAPDVSRVLLDNFREADALMNTGNPLNRLTSRERQVMQMVAEGNTSKEIAKVIGVTDKTVDKHRSNLMAKLNLKDLAHLIRTAIKHGLIFIDE